MNETGWHRLGEYIRVKHGFAFKGEYFSDTPTPHVLVTPGNFAIGGGFQEEKLKYYSGPVPEDYVPNPDDLIVTMTDLSKEGDTLGYPALVPQSTEKQYLHNQRIGLVEIDRSADLDKNYLFYRLRADDYRNHVLATASGSTVRHTSPTRIYEFEARIPPIEEQRAIAQVLGVFDEKIDQNRQTTQALERLIQAIFRAWFVDFEPVRAKAAGATAFPSIPQNIFDALPSRLVDSIIGLIPEGWGVGKIGDVARERRESISPSDVDKDTPYIGLEHIPRHSIAITDWGQAASVSSNKARFSFGQILFGKLRPYFHKVGVAPIDGVCSTDIVVVQPSGTAWFGFVLGHVSSDEFVAYATAYSTGTRMPRTSWRDMSNYVVCIPPHDIAAGFSEIATSMVSLIVSNSFESRKLSESRNFLAPKLLYGQVEIDTDVASGGASK